MFYIEAYRQDGSQVLGNLDGQVALRVKNYKRTKSYFNLKYGHPKASKAIHHWKVVDEAGKCLEKIENPNFKVEVTPEKKQRRKESTYRKHLGDDMYSYSLFVKGKEVYSGMSQSEAKWRRDRYVETGVL